jgi:regulator of protease activity HflC (stomatin/prohibitin superfamily)
MFGIRYFKTTPTTYVQHLKGGKVKREGAGLSFYYYAPTSTIVAVPVASADVPFVFNLVTKDFQDVTLQGQLTYRVFDAKRVASLLDFSVDANQKFKSDDPAKLEERLVNATQVLAGAIVAELSLRDALAASPRIVAEVTGGLRAAEEVAMLGVEPLALSILKIRPTPEMARALEAESRERLSREADEAIYARRNAAVEQERIIKESELSTELAVVAKQREIRERKMASDIAVEEQRTELIGKQVENARKDADSRAYSLRATLEPLEKADWKTLMAVSANGGDPRTLIALAFRELAENAQKIGELNMSPDLLKSLLNK